MSEKHFDDGFDLESRLRAAESADDAPALSRVRGRVNAYVQAAPAAGRRIWSGRLTAFAVVGLPVAAAAAVAAALLIGAPRNTSQVLPAGTPAQTPVASPVTEPSTTPAPTPTATPPPGTFLVETTTPANQVGPITVHWVGLDGQERASKQLPTNEAVLGAGGGRVLVYRGDGHVLELRLDGSTADLAGGMPTSSTAGQTTAPVRALVSPDGRSWIWSTMTMSGSSVTSQVWLGADGKAPRAVARAVEDQHALEPYAWTLANPLIAHQAIGVGGYILFNQAHGQVAQLDLASGKTTSVGPPSNGLGPPASEVGLAGSGAAAYAQVQGNQGFVVVNGPGQRGLSATVPARNQTGGLLFDAGSNHLVYCTSPAAGPPHERFETHVIDLNSGAQTKFGPADLRPAAWLPDGRLVEFRTASDGDGAQATYLVSLDGRSTRVSGYSQFVGLVQLP